MAPLRLTDSELDVIWNAARPLEVQDRFGRRGGRIEMRKGRPADGLFLFL
jgi:hypothetical protein